ncbi:MAG: hypothetical protein Q7K34_00680 [archaeon]|nr:hypothetical protein [archaeon]
MNSKNISVYGCKVIRDELRDTPLYKKIKNKKVRILLLNAYDRLVKKHDLQVSDLANYLTIEYLKEYKGGTSREKLYSDFLIVSIASLKEIDIICTNDGKTMCSAKSKKCCEKVNQKNGLKTSIFISFEEFRKMI